MRWFRRGKRKRGASERGSERYATRVIRGRPRSRRVEPEEVIASLNYEPEAAEAEAESDVLEREAWGAAVTIAIALAALMLLSVLVYAGVQAGSSWRAWRAAPLVSAAAAGDTDQVRLLIDGGADLDGRGRSGDTALVAAVRAGHADAVEMLLDAGAEPSDEAVNTALRYERRAILASLIEAGADPDLRNDWSTISLLEMAAGDGDEALVDLLLAHGADPSPASGENPFGLTPLHSAIAGGEIEIVRLLLDHGADPMVTYQGWTAVEAAQIGGHDEIVLLLEAAAEQH